MKIQFNPDAGRYRTCFALFAAARSAYPEPKPRLQPIEQEVEDFVKDARAASQREARRQDKREIR